MTSGGYPIFSQVRQPRCAASDLGAGGSDASGHPTLSPVQHIVYLGLGSNLGDRDAHLRAALSALPPAVTVTRVSSVYDTAPELVTEQPRFHNIVCAGTTALSPEALLRTLKTLETALGREPGPRYGPRTVDIDILLYDDLVLRTPELTIPHAHMAERAFVLAPLAELAPELRHPVLGRTVRALAADLAEADVRRVGPLFAPAS
jgi:2-amino-4-hydroxy-6-hydroxymethyldihydropteridine diphosphokinase